jgi:transglutaminase/protease-like cytokinesis protein 3
MRLIIMIILLGLFSAIPAQKNNVYQQIDNLTLQIPDSLAQTTAGIAGYINLTFNNPADKSRAVFIWIAKNIQYDVENMFAINYVRNTTEIVEKVLKTRKGICRHYAELFNDIARQSGIKAYVISGYTRQQGFVDYLPHAWCAGLIDSTWYLFDPTWGSGYLQNAKFVRKVNNYYFKAKPEQLIKSHMPFDPLWQFLNYPLTSQEFYEEKFKTDKTKPLFNFADTLGRYENESEIERLISASNRIERNGVKNALIFNELQDKKREVEYYHNKAAVETYNSAASTFNEGVNQLNRFITYRNNQFKPPLPDSSIQQMVDTTESSFNLSRQRLSEIKNPDANMLVAINQLTKAIDEAMINVNEQKTFLQKYIKTSILFRKTLFYKYTWLGLPLN